MLAAEIMAEDQPQDIERALVVVAHPDDAEYGCAGTVALWTRSGVAVNYVICTDGSQGSADPEADPEQLRVTRKVEQEEACRVLGVEGVEFLGHPDGMLTPDVELRRELTLAIRRLRPDVVVCQNAVRQYLNLGVNHPDHLAAGEAAITAVYPFARNPHSFPEQLQGGLTPHVVREVWVTGTENPDHFVDVSSTLERKLEALRCHRSQMREDPSPWVLKRLAETGRAHGLEYAESFRRVLSR